MPRGTVEHKSKDSDSKHKHKHHHHHHHHKKRTSSSSASAVQPEIIPNISSFSTANLSHEQIMQLKVFIRNSAVNRLLSPTSMAAPAAEAPKVQNHISGYYEEAQPDTSSSSAAPAVTQASEIDDNFDYYEQVHTPVQASASVHVAKAPTIQALEVDDASNYYEQVHTPAQASSTAPVAVMPLEQPDPAVEVTDIIYTF